MVTEYIKPEDVNEMELAGYFDEFGYTIEDCVTGKELYRAGNNPLESSSVVSNGLPIKTIKKYCKQTLKEMAKENNCGFVGVFRKEDIK